MKKFCFLILIFMFGTSIVLADDIYFTNYYGGTLTKNEYDRLIKYFDYETLYTFSNYTLNYYKNSNDILGVESQKIVKVDEYFDENGNYLYSTEAEISLADVSKILNARNYSDTHTTSVKKLHMQVTSGGATNSKGVVITNTWLSIPKVKSYDVLAIRPVSSSSISTTLNTASFSAVQIHDGTTISYSLTGNNTKHVPNYTGTGGIGVSMNIADNVSSSLINKMSMVFMSNNNPFVIEGTYQHAVKTITLSQSKDYNFYATGLGGVLSYNNGLSSYYDGMQGVTVVYNLNEEYN